MHCITIATRKGGAGKSSLASHLSVLAAAGNKPVLLFDCDEQGSLVSNRVQFRPLFASKNDPPKLSFDLAEKAASDTSGHVV